MSERIPTSFHKEMLEVPNVDSFVNPVVFKKDIHKVVRRNVSLNKNKSWEQKKVVFVTLV